MIRIEIINFISNPFSNLPQVSFINHTTYAAPRPTYTNLPSDPLKQEWVHATREYSTLPIQPIATWVHATLTISLLPVHE